MKCPLVKEARHPGMQHAGKFRSDQTAGCSELRAIQEDSWHYAFSPSERKPACSNDIMKHIWNLPSQEIVMNICPCGTSLTYDACCLPIIKGERQAETAEQLMRSRYSAYVTAEIEYLRTSLHPEHRADFNEKTTRTWAEGAQWHGLEILGTTGGGPDDSEGKVEFAVSYTEDGAKRDYRERATFGKKDANWYLVSGEPLPVRQVVREAPKTGRNDPCTCGSGNKYKKCCGR